LLLAGNDDLMLLWVSFVSGLLLLVAINAELLLSVLHDAALMLIVAFYSRAKFCCGIVRCAVASGELFIPPNKKNSQALLLVAFVPGLLLLMAFDGGWLQIVAG
jgi:hypothetical protein